jgi:hypothetical protein
MKNKPKNPAKASSEEERKANVNPAGYPLYPESEDIYAQSKEEKDLDPENVSKVKAPNLSAKSRKKNEADFEEDETGEDLDVPGSEADEAEENSGSEDEENNFYSLGGDGHNDLDEDKGE